MRIQGVAFRDEVLRDMVEADQYDTPPTAWFAVRPVNATLVHVMSPSAHVPNSAVSSARMSSHPVTRQEFGKPAF